MSVDWLTVEIHWYVPILFVVAFLCLFCTFETGAL